MGLSKLSKSEVNESSKLIFIFCLQTFSVVKMMVTNGEPSSYGDFSHPLASTATWNECVQYCYDLGSCVVS